MNGEQRAAFITEFLEEHCMAVMRDKGTEYSRGEVDVNSNFKRGAEVIGADAIQVLYVYMSKHLDSIANYVKTRETPSGESIEGRIGDAVNYLLILASLLEEQRTADLPGLEVLDRATGANEDYSCQRCNNGDVNGVAYCSCAKGRRAKAMDLAREKARAEEVQQLGGVYRTTDSDWPDNLAREFGDETGETSDRAGAASADAARYRRLDKMPDEEHLDAPLRRRYE